MYQDTIMPQSRRCSSIFSLVGFEFYESKHVGLYENKINFEELEFEIRFYVKINLRFVQFQSGIV